MIQSSSLNDDVLTTDEIKTRDTWIIGKEIQVWNRDSNEWNDAKILDISDDMFLVFIQANNADGSINQSYHQIEINSKYIREKMKGNTKGIMYESVLGLYRKHENVYPRGVLLTYGYGREMGREFKMNIPDEIMDICQYYVDIFLEYLCTNKGNSGEKWIQRTEDITKCHVVNLQNKRWNELNKNDILYILDKIIFDKSINVREIEFGTSSKNERSNEYNTNNSFDIISFISKALKYCKELKYINISNCNIDGKDIKLLCHNFTLIKPTTKLWLDISNNPINDDGIHGICLMLDYLIGIDIDNLDITDKSIAILQTYIFSNTHLLKQLGFIKLNNNSKITKSSVATLTSKIKDKILIFDTNFDEKNADYPGQLPYTPTKTLNKWNGIWYSQYGSHGREYLSTYISTTFNGKPCLICRKITGDPNVPKGKVTFVIPFDKESEWKNNISGKQQIRSATENDDGFSWDKLRIIPINDNKLSKQWRYWTSTMQRI